MKNVEILKKAVAILFSLALTIGFIAFKAGCFDDTKVEDVSPWSSATKNKAYFDLTQNSTSVLSNSILANSTNTVSKINSNTADNPEVMFHIGDSVRELEIMSSSKSTIILHKKSPLEKILKLK